MDNIKLKGRFHCEILDVDGKTVLDQWDCENGITTAGLNDLLNVYFGAGTQKTVWYVGLIDNAGFSSLAAGDTPSSHSGWTESTAYSESVRQTWTLGSASAGVVTNATSMTFTMNATTTINGIFIISVSTKGGTTGTLWSTGSFSSTKSLVSGQALKVTYSLTAA